ncbi:hypothetical protein SAMN05421858_2411 [Haladaptatus litoreus]|uniref:Uncharacterized protein n=1 Tax=Haladaptatus litoreus TaxID=553468 RepID=A0A1N7B8V7_9EURY|nr:hypothetical protein [Haladaptatus litoreus]SIR47752.1 hypothetical protein SAMN05421858_2411 [Haladaptatus litoreus]
MVNSNLLRDVTVNVTAGILIILFGRWLGATIAGGIDGFGIVVFAFVYLVSLFAGVYVIVRALGNLVEDVVRNEVAQ